MKNEFIESLLKEDEDSRIALLESHAMAVEEGVYSRELTEAELAEVKETYVGTNIKLAKFDEELQKIKEEFKNKMKPLQLLGKEYLQQLRSRTKEVEGRIFSIDDQDAKMLYLISEDGTLISSRPLLSHERQLRINTEKEAM